MIKKICINICLFLMAFAIFALAGCGEYKEISETHTISSGSEEIGSDEREDSQIGPGSGEDEDSASEENGETSEEAEEEKRVFSVLLTFNDKPFDKAVEYGVKARWMRTDGISEVHVADFDETGYARVEGLDGNYQVSLEIPEDKKEDFKFVYNTNINKTTNGNRDIIIKLYRIGRAEGGSRAGRDVWKPLEIKNVGVFEATIKTAGQVVYYEYIPARSGTYTIESWVDVKMDNVNPKLIVYESHVTRDRCYTVNSGGPTGLYTKNFSHPLNMDESNFSKGGGGGQVSFILGITAEEIDEQYPITVRFAIHYKAPYSYDTYPTEIIAATELNELLLKEINELRALSQDAFTAATGLSVGEWNRLQALSEWECKDVHTPYRYFSGTDTLKYILKQFAPKGARKYPEKKNNNVTYFDGDMFEYYDPAIYENGDGFYHVYDEVKYASTDGFGPILYALVTKTNRFFSPYTPPGSSQSIAISLSNIEMPGNKCLSVSVRDEEGKITLRNHKLFIEGYDALSGNYFCDLSCTCAHYDSKVCLDDCSTCTADCRTCPAEAAKTFGYADVAVGEGVFPVTVEMKLFLQQFAVSQRYFMDGNGWAETSLNPTIDCAEDDQWLFGCEYYE